MKQTSRTKQFIVAAVAGSLLLAAACSGDGPADVHDEENYHPHEPVVESDDTPMDGAPAESVSPTVSILPELLVRSTVSLQQLRASLEQVTKAEVLSDEQAEPSMREGEDGSMVRGKLDPEMLRFLIATRERMEATR